MGEAAGEKGEDPEGIFSTWLEGNRPCLPLHLPVHQSVFVSSIISMVSPEEKHRSFGSCLPSRTRGERKKG